jgi:delta 1-pyrroline-5-carboxylate dehydrogenase
VSGRSPARARRDPCRAFEAITKRADELALLMTLEMGKPVAESRAEVTYAAEFLRWFAEEAVRIEGRFATVPNCQGRPRPPRVLGSRRAAPAAARAQLLHRLGGRRAVSWRSRGDALDRINF